MTLCATASETTCCTRVSNIRKTAPDLYSSKSEACSQQRICGHYWCGLLGTSCFLVKKRMVRVAISDRKCCIRRRTAANKSPVNSLEGVIYYGRNTCQAFVPNRRKRALAIFSEQGFLDPFVQQASRMSFSETKTYISRKLFLRSRCQRPNVLNNIFAGDESTINHIGTSRKEKVPGGLLQKLISYKISSRVCSQRERIIITVFGDI